MTYYVKCEQNGICSCANGVADTEEVRKTVDPRIELCGGFCVKLGKEKNT